jgi:hypothetical protein
MHQARQSFPAVLATALAAILLLAGCQTKSSATPENFIKGLNAHFQERAECLFPDAPRFPYETSDPEKTRLMDTLVKAQLLTVSKEPSIHASRYTPTTTGSRAAPRFCYGHRVVTGIDTSTPPTKPAKGYPETQVVYRYELKDVPIWAKTPEVLAAFPAMAKATTGTLTDKAVLDGTIAGWQVPD